MNEQALDELRTGVGDLLIISGSDLQRASETESQFSLTLPLQLADIVRDSSRLARYGDLFDLRFEYQIQGGNGEATLKREGLFVVRWEEDPSLSPPPLDPAPSSLYVNLARTLAIEGEHINEESFSQDLQILKQAGASISVSLRIFVDKTRLIKQLGLPQNVRILFYLAVDKLLREFERMEIPDICNFLIPRNEHTLIVMLGNVSGFAEGPNIKLLGREHWTPDGNLNFEATEINKVKAQDAIVFRNDECNWETGIFNLTPFHLLVEKRNLDQPTILDRFDCLRDALSMAYLSNRLQRGANILTCEITGHKKVQIAIQPQTKARSFISIFKLFSWAYENSSSDKLGIVRNILTLQLGENPETNYDILGERANEILGVAKSNFQLFLKRSVELYFDKRLRVSEFLQKFGEGVSDSVSTMTSDLVSDVYKTIGIILGVVIASLLDPKSTPRITWLASLLYTLYILFILVYLLLSTYWRFSTKVREYQNNIAGLRDVLSEEEIVRLEGTSFGATKRMFLFFFALTYLVYAILGTLAYLLMSLFLKIS